MWEPPDVLWGPGSAGNRCPHSTVNPGVENKRTKHQNSTPYRGFKAIRSEAIFVVCVPSKLPAFTYEIWHCAHTRNLQEIKNIGWPDRNQVLLSYVTCIIV